MFYTLNIKDNDYKLRLTAKSCVELEKKLGTNPVNVLMEMASENKMPSLEKCIVILHASLQAYQHDITLDRTYELYDSFIEDGKTIVDLIPAIIETFKCSGLIPEDNEEKGKNAQMR